MGAGCSSPLRRLGGKRGKPARRHSSLASGELAIGDRDNNNQSDQQNACQQQPTSSSAVSSQQKHRFILENENTVQSEINDDHPSTASYYTDGKNHQDETTKLSGAEAEHSTIGLEPAKQGNGTIVTTTSSSLGGGSAAARMMGLDRSPIPHDRHLLVSPALSPAPSSTCYSPSPANSTSGSGLTTTMLDLNEAFKTLTFGLPNNLQEDQQATTTTRIKQPDRQHQSSELHNYYTKQLVQSQEDLIKHISVIFITTDTLNSSSSSSAATTADESLINQFERSELLANLIESNLKTYCDEQLFNLRFFNLSQAHLSEHFHINNLSDASMKILEQEYQENSQRIIIIVLSNVVNNISSSDAMSSSASSSNTANQSQRQQNLDKRQLPAKIEAQLMNKLQIAISKPQQDSDSSSNNNDDASDLLKLWYNKIGNIYYLNPIYLVYPKILNESKKERDEAWQNWLKDSNQMIKAISLVQEKDTGLETEIRLNSLFDTYIEYITNKPALQKRTLLIRNYSRLLANQQQLQESTTLSSHQQNNLIDFARLLSDPNKLTIKRAMDDEELNKTINDWIIENFNKFVENILGNQIINGKQVPPFIEPNLFIELTRQRHCLEYYLDNVTENFETKCHNFYRSQIQPILDGVINDINSNNNTIELANNNNLQQQQQQASTNHLVFISGPKGCGKSSLFAQLIKYTAQDLFNKAQIIYRFCGVTLNSLSPNRLLRSICEQFCQTQGENIAAASYIYSARKEIMNSLNMIIKQQISLIFLDGLDSYKKSQLSSSSSSSDCCAELDWLCEIQANPRIKFFIMLETDSDLYRKVLGTYTDATYISLDHPSIAEWAQMLTSTARSKRFNSATSLYDEIKNLDTSLDSKDNAKLTYKDFSDIIHMCRIRKLNNESIYPELSAKLLQRENPIQNLKNIQQIVISHLHYLISPYQLCAFFIILNSSRNGLKDSDIINIMTMISSLKTSGTEQQQQQQTTKFSRTLLKYLKIQLQPWLIYILCDKTVKITIQLDFFSRALDYYVPNLFNNIVGEVRELLIDYFSRPQQQSKQQQQQKVAIGGLFKSSTSDNNSTQFERINRSDSVWLATQASELVNLLILTNPPKAREHILNKQQFFNLFFHGSMPEEFIEDYEMLKDLIEVGKKASSSSSSNAEELSCLVDYIRKSIYPLRYDGGQIYSQIYCRAYETIKSGKKVGKKLSDILNLASCPPVKNLYPISETSVNSFIKTRIGQNQPPTTALQQQSTSPPFAATPSIQSSSNAPPTAVNSQSKPTLQPNTTTIAGQQQQQQPAKQKIYTIKDNHRHVIVIYPDKGSLAVWDIFEEKAVRSIQNLDQPRDLRMVDQKRAVILCNRELRFYDLDSGNLLNKLKGVMNQKMPFFEIFGDNYVVALARNRMYVNMLNLSTGELETTFKVGEDRFLNSLLVSAGGGICVCGDETQKPFPLLVWNLNERRLMYDLRLDRHEFLTRMSAISDDGHFVVSVCRQLGETPTDVGASVGASSSSNSNSSGHKSSPNFIVIYDLNSGTLFKKWKPGLDTCGVAISLTASRSGKVVNSIVNNTILIWDLATGSKRHTLTGHSAPADVIQVQNGRLFSMDSTCQDQSLRIWDIEEGYCLAVFSPDAPINSCQMSTLGEALVCGFAAETRLSTLVVCKNETVNDVVKRNKRRKSSKSLYIFDEPASRKSSS